MSRLNDETFANISSILYRMQPPPLDVSSSSFTLKRENSNGSCNSLDQTDMTPIKKLKKDLADQDITYIGSPRDFRRIRSDLLDARSTILTLEGHIQELHNMRKEMEIIFDKERTNLSFENKKYMKQRDELESQLQSVRQREKKLKNELAEMQNKNDKLKIEYDVKLEELEKMCTELNDKIKVDDHNRNSESVNLQRKVDEIQRLYKLTLDECSAHKNLANDLKRQVAEENSLQRQLELKEQTIQTQNMKIKELEYEVQNFQEFQQQAKTQLHKLAKYSELERENKKLKEETNKLKEEVHNKLLLEEEVHNLKSRLVTFKEREQILSTLQTAQMQNEMYLEEWRSLARGLCEKKGTDTVLVRSLKSMVEQLQQQEINLTSDKVKLESQMSSAEHDAKVAKHELEKSKNLLKEMQNGIELKDIVIRRMKKKILLLTGERDSYRLQLDSYEKDLSVCFHPSSSGTAAVNQQYSQKERINNLEKIVEEYRDLVSTLENDLHNAGPSTHGDSIAIRTEQMNRMKNEIDKLKNENEMLRERKDRLELQLEQYVIGEDVPNGRIIHNVKNPVTNYLNQQENDVEKLQFEVERLKRKIHNLEEGIEESKLNMSICPEEIKTLREQKEATDIQMQKLKEYFKSSMQEFRNVVYMLLGYKIDKTSSQYKLTSMYAECEDDALFFKLNSEGSLDLLENRFSSTLEALIDLHLRHQKSIPVFLSVLTIDTFNTNTTQIS